MLHVKKILCVRCLCHSRILFCLPPSRFLLFNLPSSCSVFRALARGSIPLCEDVNYVRKIAHLPAPITNAQKSVKWLIQRNRYFCAQQHPLSRQPSRSPQAAWSGALSPPPICIAFSSDRTRGIFFPLGRFVTKFYPSGIRHNLQARACYTHQL